MNDATRLSALALMVGLAACGKKAPPPAPTAEVAMNRAIAAINAKDPSGFWHMLPGSYQNGLNEALHQFAGKMDAGVWEGATDKLDRAEKLLRAKKSLLLDMPKVRGNPVTVDHLDAVLGVLASITKSELMDLNKLKKADLGKMLAGTGASILDKSSGLKFPDPTGFTKEALQDLASYTAELESESGDTAKVKIVRKDNSERIAFVRLEGKWIPKEMAEDLPNVIRAAKEAANGLDGSKPAMAAAKTQTQAILDVLDKVLDQLEQAETPEEALFAVQGLSPIFHMISMQTKVRTERKNACVANLRLIHNAAHHYMVIHRTATVPAFSDANYLKHFRPAVLPVCPTGGTYAPAVNEKSKATCSLGPFLGHKL